jgi:uncharacterized protein YacL
MNNENKNTEKPKSQKWFRDLSLNVLLSIIGAVLGIVANVFSAFTLIKAVNIPPGFLYVIFSIVVVVVMLLIGFLISKRQDEKRRLVIARVKKDDAELLSVVGKRISELIQQEQEKI